VAQRQELRIKTANAFQYLYLSLGQRAIKAWQEGVSYQQKVLSWLACCFRTNGGIDGIQDGTQFCLVRPYAGLSSNADWSAVSWV